MSRRHKKAKAPKVAAPNLFDFVADGLAVGGQMWDAIDVATATDAGITHVIDLRSERNDAAMWRTHAPQVTYLWLGVDDDGSIMPDWWWTEIVHFAETALSDPTARLLVHCAHGMLRGPSAAYAVLRAVYGYSRTETVTAIQTARPIATPIFGSDFDDFNDGISEYQREANLAVDEDEDERPSYQPLKPWMRGLFGDTVQPDFDAIADRNARMLAIAENEIWSI